jgi:15-cis-phytoene synthase
MSSLAADHAACAETLRRSGSSFALPIRLLPPAKRRGTTALYAFCRRADDIVDDAPDTPTAAAGLETFASGTHDALAGVPCADPVLRALADTVRRYAIPTSCIDEIVAGCRMDLTERRYATFADLETYCGRVAGAVGVAAIHIWGFTDPEAVERARDCGLAFQLTNILRDIPEDLARGRVYLPEEDLEAAGASAADLVAGRIGPAFTAVARAEVARAEAAYARAAVMDRMLTTAGRCAFRSMFGVYRSILAAVRRAGPAIFTARVRPPRGRLVAAAVATLAFGPGGRS